MSQDPYLPPGVTQGMLDREANGDAIVPERPERCYVCSRLVDAPEFAETPWGDYPLCGSQACAADLAREVHAWNTADDEDSERSGE